MSVVSPSLTRSQPHTSPPGHPFSFTGCEVVEETKHGRTYRKYLSKAAAPASAAAAATTSAAAGPTAGKEAKEAAAGKPAAAAAGKDEAAKDAAKAGMDTSAD